MKRCVRIWMGYLGYKFIIKNKNPPSGPLFIQMGSRPEKGDHYVRSRLFRQAESSAKYISFDIIGTLRNDANKESQAIGNILAA